MFGPGGPGHNEKTCGLYVNNFSYVFILDRNTEGKTRVTIASMNQSSKSTRAI